MTSFPTLQPGEKIALILRRHKLYYIKYLLVLTILLAIPILAYFTLRYFLSGLVQDSNFNIIFVLTTSIYLCFVILLSFISWLNYYLDVWVITSYRLIEYEQKSLFHRETSELNLTSIQDIMVQIKGILPSLFHFGTIYIQTAGTTERFIFKDSPHPEQTKKTITDLQNRIIYKKQEDQKENKDIE